VSDAIQFGGSGTAKVFVEWAVPTHGEATLELVDANNNNEEIDLLKFHSFKGLVIDFSGEPNPVFRVTTGDRLRRFYHCDVIIRKRMGFTIL
jgi:hypothetical protein